MSEERFWSVFIALIAVAFIVLVAWAVATDDAGRNPGPEVLVAYTLEDAVAQCRDAYQGAEQDDCIDAAFRSWGDE